MKNSFIKMLGVLFSVFVLCISCSGYNYFADARIFLPDAGGRSVQANGEYEKSDISKYSVVIVYEDSEGKSVPILDDFYEGGDEILLKNLDASFLYNIKIVALTEAGKEVAVGRKDFTLAPGRANNVSVSLKFINQNKPKTSYIPKNIRTIAGSGEAIVKSYYEFSKAMEDSSINTVILGADIKLSDWNPIDFAESKVLDGNGYIIALEDPGVGHMYPYYETCLDDNVYYIYTSLFKKNNGTVKNLKVEGNICPGTETNSIGNRVSFGGLAIENYGLILNCECSVEFMYTDPGIIKPCGGIAYENKGEIVNSVYSGYIYVTYNAEYNAGRDNDYGAVGGIAGYNSGKIFNCLCTGELREFASGGDEKFVKEGGIAGSLNKAGGRSCEISNCFFLVNDPNIFNPSSGRYFYCHNGRGDNSFVCTGGYFTSVGFKVSWVNASGQENETVYEALNRIAESHNGSEYEMNRW